MTTEPITTEPEDAYERALKVESFMTFQGITSSQIDLLNVIERVVDDDEPDLDAEGVIRRAFNHYVTNGGVDYDAAVGELLYSTVRDAVENAMRKDGFIKDPWAEWTPPDSSPFKPNGGPMA